MCFVHSKVPSIKSHIIALYEPLRKQELLSQLWDTLTGRHLLSRCQTWDLRNKSAAHSLTIDFPSPLLRSHTVIQKALIWAKIFKALFGTEWILKTWHKNGHSSLKNTGTNLCNKQHLQARPEEWEDAAVAEASSLLFSGGCWGFDGGVASLLPWIRAPFSRETGAKVLLPGRALLCPWAQHCTFLWISWGSQ